MWLSFLPLVGFVIWISILTGRYDEWLEGHAAYEPSGKYWDNRTGEDNANVHLKG